MAQAPKVELTGIIPPLVTPFDAAENIDIAALRAEVRFHLAAGVHGICVTGSTGDGQMLSVEQSVTVARTAVEEVNGAVPVIAGIIRDSTAEVIRYGSALKGTGVDALQVTPVHYLFQPDEERTIEYYRRITEATGMPVVVYNVIPYALIPARTVYRVIQEVDLVVGVKQSGGDIHQLADLLKASPSGVVLTAVDDLLYPAYLLGAAGAVSATLTVVPGLCVEQWNAVAAGDHKTALDIHNKLLPIWRSIDGPNMTMRIKAALAMLGRDGGLGAHPLTPASEAEKAAIRAALVEAGLLPL
ncbi:dihydrodipicolinate synthase family protein [Acrocarpospora macrocephala]|uniref:Dihydrodipicolinate synthase family protein n=1 Tax=Acrocarpospora macrocephala TaxID=150177 RepID=A0A5M3WZZ2_9ACTN|nr:dihydrodipicolinate synthase family protein [Acrocarpospora macrocephala]GES13902.1 dihydrodipicolinate synthase family protein [Acrocarpospora macrocephala]